jgi:hypothetical protein
VLSWFFQQGKKSILFDGILFHKQIMGQAPFEPFSVKKMKEQIDHL